MVVQVAPAEAITIAVAIAIATDPVVVAAPARAVEANAAAGITHARNTDVSFVGGFPKYWLVIYNFNGASSLWARNLRYGLHHQ